MAGSGTVKVTLDVNCQGIHRQLFFDWMWRACRSILNSEHAMLSHFTSEGADSGIRHAEIFGIINDEERSRCLSLVHGIVKSPLKKSPRVF